jgi:serine protease Do
MMLMSAAQAAPAPASFAPMLEPRMPAVVNISTTQKVKTPGMGFPQFDMGPLGNDPRGEQLQELFKQFNQQFGDGNSATREVSSLGSGFIIDPDGFVVTNNHVIDGASEITVILNDNTHLPAKLVGHDPQTDLALLKVTPSKKLPYVTFGSSDALHVGDWVVAVGNPFGLGGSVSAGIVSARGRNINAGPFDDFIQTDAAINRGNSGGPLFNADGDVVGINSAIFSPTGGSVGIGFAVPSDMAKPIIDQLRQFGRTHRGWLGVKIQEVSDEIAESLGLKQTAGALVLEINPKSPASSSLQVGDVILAFNNRPIKEMRQLPRLVADTKAGTKVDVTVWRKGSEQRVAVTIGELKDTGAKAAAAEGRDAAPATKERTVLGMALVPITPQVRAEFGLPKTAEGVLVAELDRNGDAAKSGLLPGDIIREVNQQPVADVAALQAALAQAKKDGKKHALLRVARGKGALFLTVPVK